MAEQREREVVAGIDGSAAGWAALEHAAALAESLDRPLRLLHVGPAVVPWPVRSMLTGDTFVATGERVLEDATSRALRRAPAVRLHTTLALGSATAELLARCDPGNVLVIGRAVADGSRGRLAVSVAARARCPVRVVPDLPAAPDDAAVVLSAEDLDGGELLLEQAFATAAVTGSRLVVVHAWSLPEAYRHLLSDEDVRRWHRQEEARLERVLQPIRSWHTTVQVDPQVVHGPAEEALLKAAQSARLIIAARHHDPTGPLGHLGRMVHTLIVDAACPVEVWPAGDAS